MEPENEKHSMFSRVGSFYYRMLEDTAKKEAVRMAHLTFQTRAYQQLNNVLSATTSGGYFPGNFRVVRFTDKQVAWYGVKQALQQRVVTTRETANKGKEVIPGRLDYLTIPDHFNPLTELNEGLSVRYKPLLLPDQNYGDTVLPEDATLVYGLLVDPELMVTSISLDDGTVLLANQDFSTEFGIMHFFENPIKLFPKMKFMARSYIERRRNLYCYPLGLSDVYGPVNRVVDYYRKTQAPKALYYAAAQAIGMPVVEEDDVIISVSPLLDGAAYYTEKGHRYDAAYPHTHYTPGTKIQTNEVLTGAELFRIYSAGDTLPANLRGVQLRHSAAVNGLYVPNKNGVLYEGEYFRPAYEERVPGALSRYYGYISAQERNLYTEYRPRTEFLFKNGQFAQGTHGASLTMTGNPSFTTGPGGLPAITGNFAWTGVNDGGASVPENKNWSVSFWYKYAVVPTGQVSYNLLGYFPLSEFWLVNINSVGVAFTWADASTGGYNYSFPIANAAKNTANTWHHIVVSIDRKLGSFSFYFDGQLVGNDTQDKFKNVFLVPSYPFLTSAADTMAAGGVAMSDVAFYKDYALTGDDVTKIYTKNNSGITAGDTLLPATTQEGNLLENLLDQALAGKWILVMVNENMMPRSMQIRLNEFLKREAPLGSVLLYSTLDGILAETEIADV